MVSALFSAEMFKYLDASWLTNMDPYQIETVRPRFTLFVPALTYINNVYKYIQQTAWSDDDFRSIFSQAL